MQKPELLAPAGNMACFYAAVQAGCNAVYLSGQRFGARAYAGNLTAEELQEAILIGRLHGVKIYLTVNTLTREEELPDLVDFLAPLYRAGLHGVIVQDIGVMALLHAAFPKLAIHASTQCSIAAKEAVEFYEALGVERVVPARELSIEEVKLLMQPLKNGKTMETEVFIHGSMCYAYSGRCLFSSFLGGRSGNRGRCAGTCRLPYAVMEKDGKTGVQGLSGKGQTYPLSMRDLCAVGKIPALMDAGVTSFKIEGRMKSPAYVYGVTRIYRKYIDLYDRLREEDRKERYSVDPADLEALKNLYIRSDLSEGYLETRNGKELLSLKAGGYSGTDNPYAAEVAKEAEDLGRPKAGISGSCSVFPGKEPVLTVEGEIAGKKILVEVRGEKPADPAKNRALAPEELKDRLKKTGDTLFSFRDIECRTAGAFLPVSAVNALRRDTLEAFRLACVQAAEEERGEFLSYGEAREKVLAAFPPRSGGKLSDAGTSEKDEDKPAVCALVTTREQMFAAKEADLIVVPDTLALREEAWVRERGEKILIALPQIFRESSRKLAEKAYAAFADVAAGFLVRTAEEAVFLANKRYCGRIVADHSIYGWNTVSAVVIRSWCNDWTYPLELSGRELEGTFAGKEASTAWMPVYGRIPLMISAGCIKKTAGRCGRPGSDLYRLLDRKGETFPVHTDCGHCLNTVYNSVPLYLLHCLDDPVIQTAPALVLSFSDETADETSALVRKCQEGLAFGAVPETPSAFTAGHYRKGAI